MKTTHYSILLLAGALLGFGAWLAVLWLVDPNGGWAALLIFLLTLALWVFGATAAVGTWWRLRRYGDEHVARLVPLSMRQSGVLTLCLLIAMLCLYWQIFNLPILVILVTGAGLLEWWLAKAADGRG